MKNKKEELQNDIDNIISEAETLSDKKEETEEDFEIKKIQLEEEPIRILKQPEERQEEQIEEKKKNLKN